MYLAARSWGIQPGEFWGMTLAEWMLEAEQHAMKTPEGRAAMNRDKWLAEADLSDEEWWEYHGTASN